MVIDKVEQFVKEYFQRNKFDVSHDILHVQRVKSTALSLAAMEAKHNQTQIDLEVVKLAALLHDVGDYKYAKEGSPSAAEEVSKLLNELQYAQTTIDKVLYVIENISFRKEISQKASVDHPIELKIVQDADRLDAIGAVGIARCFSFGAARDRPMYDPNVLPKENMTKEEYDEQIKKNNSVTLNHFYEKLFKIKDMMKTESGKKIAQQRHDFMVTFVEQFKQEAFN
ncbi:hypothetical protein MP638_004148 [Amoeboaphelidium occidentale]|nr:hypothetical protein MP638_004148 [Amoeboaphelidium occidentale]